MAISRTPVWITLALAAVLTGCSSTPVISGVAPPSSAAASNGVVHTATRMVGVPYRYGGTNPRGFDCSGLVYYSYRNAGIAVPRTAAQQYRHTVPVARSHLRPGDLVFFRLNGRIDHVGIYVGRNTFVHAPSSGKRVRYDRLDDAYWRRHFVRGGRVAG